MAEAKRIVIVAGPNGAGKTTFSQEFLPREAGCPDFINVDLIAAGLSPFEPERVALRAGRLMLEEIRRRVCQGESFAFETTYQGLVNSCFLYDNSGPTPRFLEAGENP